MTATMPRLASSPVPERALHERLVGGDKGALEEIYTRHASVVFNVATRVTGDRAAAEEVTQAVFLDLWQRPGRFDPERGSLRTWLMTVTHNRSVDRVREEAARRRRELHSFESRVAGLPSLEETVVASIGAERVRLALDGLCDKERTAIGLAFFGNRTYRQVATELAVPEGTIKTRIRTGLAHLAEALHAEARHATS